MCHKDEVTDIFFGTEDDEHARFVELADCGHFFEVRKLDEWMDQSQETNDGKAIDVQLKRCPRCRTPIRTSLRYGNIIKKILADFELIKRKILLGKEERRIVVDRLRLKLQKVVKFPYDCDQLARLLEHANLTDEQVNVYENQIIFLCFLQELMEKIEKCTEDEIASVNRNMLVMLDTKQDLNNLVEDLRNRVMKVRARFSDQELEELSEEMYRTRLAVDLKLLQMQIDNRSVVLDSLHLASLRRVQQKLDSEKPIGKKT